MRLSGRHAIAATTFSSLLALQVAAPASAAFPARSVIGPDVTGGYTLPAFPHRAAGVPAPTERVKLIYRLPLRNEAQLERLTQLQSTPGSSEYQHWLTPQQFKDYFAPDAATVSAAIGGLRAAGLSIDRVGHQLISVSAPAATIERNFATHLDVKRDHLGRVIAARDTYRIPASIARLPGMLIGLSAHPRPEPMYRSTGRAVPLNRYGPNGGYWFDDLKQAYAYPEYSQANGGKRHIAIVGASDFNESDAYNYFNHEAVNEFYGQSPTVLAPPPVLTHTNFAGSNPWSAGSGASYEADLDVQESGGSALGAEIDSYDIDETYNEGFLVTYAQIVEDNFDDIVSTSYGGCELPFTKNYNNGIDSTGILQAYHDVFLEGNAYGITFVFSSGDDAGLGCFPLGYYQAHASPVTYAPIKGAQFWANDPAVTAVGGTNLTTTYTKGSLDSAYVSEQAIADYPRATQDPYGTGNLIKGLYWGSGGGESVIWPRPEYQTPAAVNKIGGLYRLVPDIAMHMGGCPGDAIGLKAGQPPPCVANLNNPGGDSYDVVSHDGVLVGLIGTSASAPEFAGLLAVIEQAEINSKVNTAANGRLGNVNYTLYRDLRPPYVHQGMEATDGVSGYAVPKGKLGYNLITGLGTPDATSFIDGLTRRKFTVSGLPQTASNP